MRGGRREGRARSKREGRRGEVEGSVDDLELVWEVERVESFLLSCPRRKGGSRRTPGLRVDSRRRGRGGGEVVVRFGRRRR